MKKLYFLLFLSVLFSCKSNTKTIETVPLIKTDEVKYYGSKTISVVPGKILSPKDINLAFKVSGTIQNIPVEAGSYVKRGELIAQMDPRDYILQLQATEAEYNAIKNEAERIFSLYEQQSVTKSDYEKAKFGLEQITAKYDSHKNALEDTKLYAPFSGYIQKIYYDKNEIIKAGMPIIKIIDTEDLEVETNIPSSDYIRLKDMVSFNCSVDIFKDDVYDLELINVTKKANLNQLYQMKLRLLTQGKTNIPSPGMSTMINITYKNTNSSKMQVPIASIFKDGEKSSVWKYDPSTQTISKVNVEVILILNSGYAVVEGNLNEGELIVSAGVKALKEGQKVKKINNKSNSNIGGLL